MKAMVSGVSFLLLVLTGLAVERVSAKQLEVTVGKVVARKEADWQPVSIPPYQRQLAGGGEMVMMRWTPGKGINIVSPLDGTSPHPRPDAWATISLHGSAEEATKALRDAVGGTSIGPTGVVKDLGQEAYAWGPSADGSRIVRARAGRAFIEVGGPSLDVTMRFAELVVREVESDMKASEGR